jgi:hypothetical protein
MRRKHLVAVTAAVAVLAYGAILAGAPVAVTAALGLALFASLGWVWGAVLLGPRLGELEGIVVATALALALPILGGLVLQAARIPLHARAWGGLVAGLTLTGDVLVLLRSRGGRGEDSVEDTGARPARWSPSAWQATVFGAALVVAAGAVGVARVGASMQRYPGFTELSMSGLRHNPAAADLGVVNHQGHSERYRLVLLHQGRPTDTAWNIVLPNGQTWHRTIAISTRYVTSANLFLPTDLNHPYRQVSTGPVPAQARPGATAKAKAKAKARARARARARAKAKRKAPRS